MECIDVSSVAGNSKMKICQLCSVDFTLKHFLLPLIDGQLSRGHDVTAVCSDGEYIKGIREDGYKVDAIDIERSMNVIKHLRSIWTLYWYFRRESFDVVHVHTPVAALIGRISAFLARVPFVVYTAHGFYFHDDMSTVKRKLFIHLERFAGLFTNLLFTQSCEDAETAVAERIAPSNRVFAIGNGVSVARFGAQKNDLRNELGIPDDAIVVGMIGRLVEEKGVVEYLRAAMSITNNSETEDVYFVLVGARLSSDHDATIDDVIGHAKQVLGSRLILTGMRKDIPDLLAVMTVFCLPSWREGMPRTIIEAMMSGLPVVATNIRGSREEVLDGATGLLVPVRDHQALRGAIQKLLLSPEWAKELGECGRSRAVEIYDEAKVVELQLDLLERFYSPTT